MSEERSIDNTAIAQARAKVVEVLRPTLPGGHVYGMTTADLMEACGLTKGQYTRGRVGLPHSRVLDRALQELRKAGVVEYRKKARLWVKYMPEPPLQPHERHLLEPFLKKSAQKPVVLVVDDETTVRDMHRMMLEDEFTVIEAKHGIEALALLLEKNQALPDLVITDIEMPEMFGYELCVEIHQHWPNLPVLLISGRVDLAALCFEHKAQGYMFKPAQGRDLKNLVRRLIENAA